MRSLLLFFGACALCITMDSLYAAIDPVGPAVIPRPPVQRGQNIERQNPPRPGFRARQYNRYLNRLERRN